MMMQRELYVCWFQSCAISSSSCSCYLNSVMQVMFFLPEFKQR